MARKMTNNTGRFVPSRLKIGINAAESDKEEFDDDTASEVSSLLEDNTNVIVLDKNGKPWKATIIRHSIRKNAAGYLVHYVNSKRDSSSWFPAEKVREDDSNNSESEIDESEEGNWECHRCATSNVPSRSRCSSCKGWKGGAMPRKDQQHVGIDGNKIECDICKDGGGA